MEPATLDGIPGAGQVRSRRRPEGSREHRGVFAFRRGHEARLVEILAARQPVEYVGTMDGRRVRLRVRLTDMSLARGLVAFQGLGEPHGESGEEPAGA